MYREALQVMKINSLWNAKIVNFNTKFISLLKFPGLQYTVILQIFGVVLFSAFSVGIGFTEIKNTPNREKCIEWSPSTSTDTEIKTTPNAPWSLATEILTHRKFVQLQ